MCLTEHDILSKKLGNYKKQLDKHCSKPRKMEEIRARQYQKIELIKDKEEEVQSMFKTVSTL